MRESRGEQERRATGRIDTQGKLPSRLTLDLDTEVLQISVGGMMVEVTLPLPISSEHSWTLNFGGEELTVRGIVRNCKLVPSEEQSPVYRIGIEFRGLDERQKACLMDFVNRRLGV